jgi:hypothetical protein
MRADLISETEVALQQIASCLEASVPQFVNLQPDGSGSPKMLALRDALMAFPMPAEVLYIDNSENSPIDGLAPAYTLFRLDMSQPKHLQVRFVDRVGLDELQTCQSIIEKQFGAGPGAVELIMNLHLGSMSIGENLTFLMGYDLRTHPKECARELAMHILDSNRFTERFLPVIDYSSKYHLKPDEVLPDDELLRWDSVSQQHRDCSYQQLSLQERQESVATIQLIPQVPEPVREVLRRAKKLYTFGHFEYSFFTIAQHYAYAALESAIFNRWNATLPDPLLLNYRLSRVQHETAQIPRTGWRGINAFCRQKHWKSRKLSVNGKAFPKTAAEVVDQLHEVAIINDWQHWRLRDVYLGLRNSHSHLEFCSTDLPGADTIERVAREINALFDSLPLP